MEDRVRSQLEHSDMLQGYQIMSDTNSGYGSLTSSLIQDYLKEETPKAPIILFSLKNTNNSTVLNQSPELTLLQ